MYDSFEKRTQKQLLNYVQFIRQPLTKAVPYTKHERQ